MRKGKFVAVGLRVLQAAILKSHACKRSNGVLVQKTEKLKRDEISLLLMRLQCSNQMLEPGEKVVG